MKNYKENILKNMGIYELRELARNVGVVAPTTKKRHQLEQEILKISKGELAPATNLSKKGRPPKSIKKIDNTVDIFIPKELWEVNLNKKIEDRLESVLNFNSSEIFDNEDYMIIGYLRKTIAGHYYVRNRVSLKEYVLVPYNYVSEYSLVEGDKLSLLVKKIPSEDQLIFNKLIKINEQEPTFERSVSNASVTDIVFGKNKLEGFEGVSEGENVLLVTENVKSDVEIIKQVIKPLSKNYKVVVLASGISTYTKLLLEKEFEAELIYTVVEDHPAFSYENVINVFNYIDLLLKTDNKVVLVAIDVLTLLKQIEEFLILENKKTAAQEAIEALRIVKKLFDYGKVLGNQSSVTVFTHCLKNEIEEDIFKKEFSKFPDKIFYL